MSSDALERRVERLEKIVTLLLRQLEQAEQKAGRSAQNVSIIRQGGG